MYRSRQLVQSSNKNPPREHNVRGRGFLSRSRNYDCFALGSRDRTSIAPKHVIPAPRRYTAVEPPSGIRLFPGLFPSAAEAAGTKHNNATTASHHFRFMLFIATTPFEEPTRTNWSGGERDPSQFRPRYSGDNYI